MRRIIQRLIAAIVLSIGIVAAAVGTSYGQDKEVRIGYQKYGRLVLLKGKGTLEKKLAPLGYTVKWAEFPAGPQLLEALNVGAIDIGPDRRGAADLRAGRRRARSIYIAFEPAAPQGRGDPRAQGSPDPVRRRPEGQEDRAQQGLERPLPAGARRSRRRASATATSSRSS